MTSIATLSGRVIDFVNPDPDQVLLDDIAAGLARHARYTGQTVRTYSVAMHCMLVASLVAPEHRLHALLHDAPEAYTGDAPSPFKEAMRTLARFTGHQSPYDTVEHGLWKAICRRYDLAPDLPPEVARADHFAMVIEAPILQPKGWQHAVWDFARADEREVAGAHREQLLKLCALPQGGYTAYLWDVTGELARRRATA